MITYQLLLIQVKLRESEITMSANNVLVICSDEHARAFSGCYGHSDVRTPAIDQLSKLGTTFEHAYTPSPICVPARACLATGLQVHENRCWSSAEPYCGQHESWMHRMRDCGYPVIAIGKLHFRSSHDDNGFTEEILPMHVANNGAGWPQSLLRDPLPAFSETHELADQTGKGESEYTDYDRRIVSEACKWLRRYPSRKQKYPWILFVSFASPHYPLTAPDKFYDLYEDCKFEISFNDYSKFETDHPVLSEIRRFWNYDDYFDDGLRLEARRCYFALVSFLDDNIRKVLEALEASGCKNDTVIIYTSDHGEMLGHLGFWTKSVMYENSAGIPLLAVGPGFESRRSYVPVSLTDIGTTVEHAMGYETSHSESWRPMALQKVNDRFHQERAILSQYHDGGTPVSFYMIRLGNWKYVYYAGGYRPQLFHISRDPMETNDLSESLFASDALKRACASLHHMLDPEEVSGLCRLDQAAKVRSLGGREAILAMNSFNHTPVQFDD